MLVAAAMIAEVVAVVAVAMPAAVAADRSFVRATDLAVAASGLGIAKETGSTHLAAGRARSRCCCRPAIVRHWQKSAASHGLHLFLLGASR